jgi:hypothetical protein
MSLPPERKPDWEETQDYRGYAIELSFFKNPRTVSMHAYVAKGGTRVIVPFSEAMPIRDFATKEDAREVGIAAARREIDAIIRAA